VAFRIDADGLLAAAFRALTLLFPRDQKSEPILRHEETVVGQAEFGYHAVRSITTQAMRVIG
jgi:hypothetical protein